MYRAYLFDLDGTLADSIDLIIESYNHTMVAHGREPRSHTYWRALIGTPLEEQFKRLSDDPEDVAAMVKTYGDYNIAHHDARVKAYPGVLDTLTTLRERGAPLAIVSSKRRAGLHRFFRLVGIEGWFDALVGGDDVENGKPHPEPVHRAVAALGVSHDETVFIGDSPHDLESGRAAGVKTAAALWGPFPREELAVHGPDHWLERPKEVLGM